MTPTYPDAPQALIEHWERRRAPLGFGPGEALPPLDADLAALAAAPVPPAPPPASRHAQKLAEIAPEFAGGSGLCLLHAVLIAHLRKREAPPQAAPLFRRLWAEQSGHLLANLSTRWLISAAITFGDHGATEAERSLGQRLNILFSLMKLYEFERLFSGLPPESPHPMTRLRAPLPMGMEPFSLASGGLDVNLLAPIWRDAQATPVLGPLARELLERLNRDPGTLFRRLKLMRAARAERQARRAQRRQ